MGERSHQQNNTQLYYSIYRKRKLIYSKKKHFSGLLGQGQSEA